MHDGTDALALAIFGGALGGDHEVGQVGVLRKQPGALLFLVSLLVCLLVCLFACLIDCFLF